MLRTAGRVLLVTGLVLGAVVPGSAAHAAPVAPKGTVPGLDVSEWQGPNVDWKEIADDGARFAIIRATRGVSPVDGDPNAYVDKYFAVNQAGARANGILQGAYHFASPHRSGGAPQADFFVDNGGGWTRDGKSLPGALDMERDPYADLPKVKGVRQDCYNLKPDQMINWIRDFSRQYFVRTGRYPMIYTNQSWWKNCTSSEAEPNGTAAFNLTNPLWVANYKEKVTVPAMPGGFEKYTFWQFWNGNDKPLFPGDQNLFPGTYKQLLAFARKADKPVAYVGVKGKANKKFRRGKSATYTIQVGNGGPDDSGKVTVNVRLPKGVKHQKAGTKACKRTSYGLKCTWSNLKDDQLVKFTYRVKVTNGLKAGAKPVLRLSISAPGALDPYKKNNTAKVKATVTR
ncbi:GH25 family lysozyme [Actinocorallia populi]|uniref:GH25 family lysozyme n=1 Tax=Actinocorallia populi TaxID=2079200 RepID=UPI0018E51FD5|nr:GH25 family lysozyme [Actinocorallia populi]